LHQNAFLSGLRLDLLGKLTVVSADHLTGFRRPNSKGSGNRREKEGKGKGGKKRERKGRSFVRLRF